MDNSHSMYMGKTFEKLEDESLSKALIKAETSRFKVVKQVLAMNVVHDHVALFGRRNNVLEFDDIWVVAKKHRIHFQQVLSVLSIIEFRLKDSLDCDLILLCLALGKRYFTKTAFAKNLLTRVSTLEVSDLGNASHLLSPRGSCGLFIEINLAI